MFFFIIDPYITFKKAEYLRPNIPLLCVYRMQLTSRVSGSVSTVVFHSVYCIAEQHSTLYCCKDNQSFNVTQLTMEDGEWRQRLQFRYREWRQQLQFRYREWRQQLQFRYKEWRE